MSDRLDDSALDTLFRNARTYYAWQNKPVEDELLRPLYDLMRWGPTSANTNPARVREERARLSLAFEEACSIL